MFRLALNLSMSLSYLSVWCAYSMPNSALYAKPFRKILLVSFGAKLLIFFPGNLLAGNLLAGNRTTVRAEEIGQRLDICGEKCKPFTD